MKKKPNKKLFLKEKRKILTEERDVEKRKILLDLRIHRGNLRKFESVKEKLTGLDGNLTEKLGLLNKKILSVNKLLEKLKEDRIALNKKRNHLRKPIVKTGLAISNEKNKIKALEKKLIKLG